MHATITLRGNKAQGYDLTLTLPNTFLAEFSYLTEIYVCRAILHPVWGTTGGTKESKQKTEYYAELPKALQRIETLKDEIANAKAALTSDIVNREIIITL